jgi:16S rRNA (cytidine1402-2'-O)-methyltransferase
LRISVSKPLVSIREHNEREAADKVIAWIAAGRRWLTCRTARPRCRPGARLVAAVRAAGLTVVRSRRRGGDHGAVGCRVESGQWLFRFAAQVRRAPGATANPGGAARRAGVLRGAAPHQRRYRMAAVLLGATGDAGARAASASRTRHPAAREAAWLAADPNHVRGEFVVIGPGLQPPPRWSTGSDART